MDCLIEELTVTHDVNEANLPTKKTGAIGFEKFVIGIVVLAFAALGIYQGFFCPTCYGISERTLPSIEKSDVR